MSKTFTLSLEDYKSALVMVVLGAVLAVLINIISIGNIFELDWKQLANIGVLALFTGFVDLIKNLLANSKGTIAGVRVK